MNCEACAANRIHNKAEAQEHRDKCPACVARRPHSDAENSAHHPDHGHGYTRESGWTRPQPLPDPPELPKPVAGVIDLKKGEAQTWQAKKI